MKDNIIYFRQAQEQGKQESDQVRWIKIENDGAPNLVETLVVLWLGAWALIASVEFLSVTATALF